MRSTPSASAWPSSADPAGFMERQLRRWSQQWEASKTADLPALDALRDDLVAALPEQRASAIVHGDFRLDNTILHPTEVGTIVAVLDWEMSTLGDPLADLGAMLAYWSEAGDSEVLRRARIMAPVTVARRVPVTRAEIIERYARRTGIDLVRHRLVPVVRLLQARRRVPGDRRPRRRRRRWSEGASTTRSGSLRRSIEAGRQQLGARPVG